MTQFLRLFTIILLATTLYSLGSGLVSAATMPLPEGVTVIRDVPYGPDLKQAFDVYLPAPQARRPGLAPILIMVHGGAWFVGDKTGPGVVGEKAAHWLRQGYVFISVNNRLVPQADPLTQAMDVATAIAKVETHAADWQGDPTQILLMGHSAGGHLVALLGAKPSLAKDAGAKPWRATVSLDGLLDVPQIMHQQHAGFFDRAFSGNPDYWRQVSPIDQISAPLPMLLICSLQLKNSCGPAQIFHDRLQHLGGHVMLLPEDLGHEDINGNLGRAGSYTEAVESFIHSVGLP